MSVLIANTKNEFYKLISKKKYIVLIIVSILICIVRVLGGMLVSKITVNAVDINQITGITMQMFPFFSEIIVPLVLFMAVTDLFASEIQENTMKGILIRPITRFKIMTSKIFAAFIIGVIYYLSLFIVCTVLELVFGKEGMEYILKSFAAYLIDLIPLFILVLMGVIINMTSKSAAFAMFLSIIIYAIMKYCNYFMPSVNPILFTSYSQWHKLWIGSALPFSAMAGKIGIMLGTGLIFYTIAYMLFDRKEY